MTFLAGDIRASPNYRGQASTRCFRVHLGPDHLLGPASSGLFKSLDI